MLGSNETDVLTIPDGSVTRKVSNVGIGVMVGIAERLVWFPKIGL